MTNPNDKTVVKYSAKFVRNLGNYESVHVNIGVEDGIRNDENIFDAYARVKKFVEQRLVQEIKELEQEIGAVRDQGGY